MEAIDHEKIEARTAEILAVLSFPDALWTAKDCAMFLRVSDKHVTQRLSAHPRFPAPVFFPSDTGTRSVKKWRASEVKAWAASERIKKCKK